MEGLRVIAAELRARREEGVDALDEAVVVEADLLLFAFFFMDDGSRRRLRKKEKEDSRATPPLERKKKKNFFATPFPSAFALSHLVDVLGPNGLRDGGRDRSDAAPAVVAALARAAKDAQRVEELLLFKGLPLLSLSFRGCPRD